MVMITYHFHSTIIIDQLNKTSLKYFTRDLIITRSKKTIGLNINYTVGEKVGVSSASLTYIYVTIFM